MFAKIRSWWKGVKRMFTVQSIQKIVDEDIALTPEMLSRIETWNSMLQGRAEWCERDEYVASLKLEQGICREFADVALNEMEVSISNDKLNEIFMSAIEDLNENLQDGIGLGSFIIKPLGGKTVEYITADKFIPIHFDGSGKPDDCLFLQVKPAGDKYYIRAERHRIRSGSLTITNRAFESNSATEFGYEIELSKVPGWEKLQSEVTYPGMDKMDFGYYRNPIKNKIDNTPCGVSIYDSAINLIRKADIQGARLDWEFESGERIIHVDERALRHDLRNQGRGDVELPPLNKRLYRGLNVQEAADKELYKEYSPEFRDQNIINGLEKYYRQIEFSVGLAYGDLSDTQYVEKTATEIRTAKSRKYNRVTAIQKKLQECLEDLVAALAFYNGLYTSGYEFHCKFNDSILTDEENERQQDRQDVSMGAMSLWEYRKKWYGEDDKTAKAAIQTPAEVIE